MSRQIPLLGYIGDIKEDGGYDVTVKTADGIEVSKYEMSAEGKPIEKNYVESKNQANKIYGTDSNGKDTLFPKNDSNAAIFIIDCGGGSDDVNNVTVSGDLFASIIVLGESNKKFGMFYSSVGSQITIGYQGPEDYMGFDLPEGFSTEGSGSSLSITGNVKPGVYFIRLDK